MPGEAEEPTPILERGAVFGADAGSLFGDPSSKTTWVVEGNLWRGSREFYLHRSGVRHRRPKNHKHKDKIGHEEFLFRFSLPSFYSPSRLLGL